MDPSENKDAHITSDAYFEPFDVSTEETDPEDDEDHKSLGKGSTTREELCFLFPNFYF